MYQEISIWADEARDTGTDVTGFGCQMDSSSRHSVFRANESFARSWASMGLEVHAPCKSNRTLGGAKRSG